MRNLGGKVAVITGAGSGIGRALAIRLAGHGCRLGLLDLDEEALSGTAHLATERNPVPIRTHVADVADRTAVWSAAELLAGHYGQIDLVINNAGLGLNEAAIWQVRDEDFERVMAVNFWGVVYGTQAYLPYLARRPEAAVVNVSSTWGLMSPGLNAPYTASKFAVRGFTECLRAELHMLAPQVRAICVHPGGVRTTIAKRSLDAGVRPAHLRSRDLAAFDRMSATSPADAARVIVTGIMRRRERILIGRDAWQLDLGARLWPASYTGRLLSALRKRNLIDLREIGSLHALGSGASLQRRPS